MTKEELRDIYFGFYDQLNEPERSEAKVNWDIEFASETLLPSCVEEAIAFGFDFQDNRYYWMNIIGKYRNKNKAIKRPSFMTREKQEAHFEDFVQKQREVLLRKGNDYSKGDSDRLSNFKLAGSICQLTPEQNCLSLIATKVARLGVLLQGKIPNNESIQDSVLDLANYAVLLDMILSENQNKACGFIEREDLFKNLNSMSEHECCSKENETDIPISKEMQKSINNDVNRFLNKLSSGCRN